MKPRQLSPLPVFDEGLLSQALGEVGAKDIHLGNVWSHVLVNPGAPPEDARGLPAAAAEALRRRFAALTSSVTSESTSHDGSTTKLLIRLQDGLCVEAVLMRHDASAGKYGGGARPGGPRTTLCISSQVGCKMGCSFCATGTMGLLGDLTAGEIVEQLVHAQRRAPIRNVVFMGMGEPLNNYEAVMRAVRSMTGRCFGLSLNHITISTVGVVPRMLSLARDAPGVNLALSLHAPTQELRQRIVPAARAYKLDRLVAALDAYLLASNKSVLVEYVMLAGVNDSGAEAHALGALLAPRKVVVNLIPYNPTDVSAEFRSSSPHDVTAFQRVLREQYGLHATVRQEKGQDIGGACGQLVLLSSGPLAAAAAAGRQLPAGESGPTASRADAERRLNLPAAPPPVRDIEELCTVR